MKKLTNVSAMELVLGMEEVKANAELFDKLTKIKEQFEKKNSKTGERKPTKTQIENLKLMEEIEIILSDGEQKTITEIQKCSTNLAEFSGQKMTSLLKKLVDSEKVERFVDKKKTFFKIKK